MRRLFAFLGLMVLLGTLLLSALAQEVRFTATPPKAAIGQPIVLAASGLTPNTRYTLEIFYVPNERSVFSTNYVSDINGEASLSIFGEPSDPLGVYRAELRLGSERVAQVTFELIAAATPVPPTSAPPTSTPPAQQPTPVPTISRDGVTLRIVPESAPPRGTFRFFISGLTADEVVFVIVVNDSTGAEEYSTTRRADSNGRIEMELFTTAQNSVGTYTVRVERSSGDLLAQNSFRLESPTGNNGIVRVVPRSGSAGSTFSIQLERLRTFTDVDVQVQDPDSGNVIFETVVRTNVDGNAQVDFVSDASLPEKTYRVIARVRDVEVGRASLIIGEAAFDPDNVRVTVQPPDATLGRVLSLNVSGLPPRQPVTIEVLAEGRVLRSFTQTSNSAGNVTVTYRGDASDPTGTYSVRVKLNDEVIGTADFVMSGAPAAQSEDTPTPAPNVTVTIDPAQAARGTVHTITVSGLAPNQTVDFDVTFGGQSVYKTQKTADAQGLAVLELVAEPNDASGDYTVTVSVAGAPLGDVVLTVLDEAASPSDVTVIITPQSGERGTTHVITATGLVPNETVALELRFGNDLVYSAERQADANGKVELRLRSEPNDPVGEYTLTVVRAGVVIAQGTLTVSEDRAAPPPTPVPSDTLINREVFSGELSTRQPEVRQTFEGSAGDIVTIALESSEFDPYLRLLDRNGEELTYSDDTPNSLNSRISLFILPYTGAYTIVATSYDYYTDSSTARGGSYTLTLTRITPQAISYDTPTRVALTRDVSLQLFRFEALAGDVLNFRAEGSPDVDATFALYNDSGMLLVEDDDGGVGYLPEITRFVITRSGSYFLEVRLYDGAFDGELTLNVARVALNTLDETRTATLGGKRTSDTFTFEVSEGESVTIRVRLKDGAAANFRLTALQGEQTVMSYQAQGTPDELVVGFVARSSGTVTLIIENVGSAAVFEVTR